MLTREALFDADYQPIEGSNPQQFRTRALDALEALLPPIQEPLLASDKRMTFCAAVDRNAYLPVHNAIYSKPQKAGRSGLERRELPQPPHLRRPRRPLARRATCAPT